MEDYLLGTVDFAGRIDEGLGRHEFRSQKGGFG
jgi:hypothetical protein